VTHTQLNTHLADTTDVTGYATQSDLNTTHFLKAVALMGSAIKATPVANSISTSVVAMTDGGLHLTAVYMPKADSVTGIWYNVTTAGNFNQNNNNRIGLYKLGVDGAITLVASCANDSTLYDVAGFQQKAFTLTAGARYYATQGIYYVAFLYNMATAFTAPQTSTIVVYQADSDDMFTHGNAFCVAYAPVNDLPADSDLDSAWWNSETHIKWAALY
jgi:hypothetical protein